MKLFWCIIMITIQIVLSNRVGRNTYWEKTPKVRICVTSKGKRGVCLPPQMCGKHTSSSSSNDIFGHHCNRVNGNLLVCCSVRRVWHHYKSLHLPISDFLSLLSISLAISSSRQYFSSKPLSTTSPKFSLQPVTPVPNAVSAASSAANAQRRISSAQSFTPVPNSVSAASSASSSQRRISNAQSFTPVPNAVSAASSAPNSQRRISSAQSFTPVPNLVSAASRAPNCQRGVSSPQPVSANPNSVSAASRSVRRKRSDTNFPNLAQLLFDLFPSTVSPGKLPYSNNSNSNFPAEIMSPDTTSESSTLDPTTSAMPTSPSTKLMESDFASAFPEPPVCGVSQGSFSRVVGGNNANIGDFPWVGVIAYRVKGGFVFKCGACLITSQHSLTAAHCIVGNGNIYFVRLGVVDFTDHNKTKPVDARVKTTIAHEEYSDTNLTNDIGILVFDRKVVFTDFIRPICLPLSEELRSNNFVDYSPFIAGWGGTSYKGPMATHLQMLQMPVVSQEQCAAAYAPLKFVVIDERVVCAGDLGHDACHGDSGGPLMQPIWNPTNYTSYFYQIGVVSLGQKCGTLGWPGVYTRVTNFIPWIQRHVLGRTSS